MIGSRPRRGVARPAALAGALALVLHVPLVVYVASWWRTSAVGGQEPQGPRAEVGVPIGDVAVVTLLDDAPLGPLIDPVLLGAGDVAGAGQTHPLPNAEVELPGREAAARGGGEVGGSETWTGRDDAFELRAQSWNHPSRYRSPHVKSGRLRRSPEAIARAETRGYGDRHSGVARAAEGVERGQPGTLAGTGSGASSGSVEERSWQDADPIFDGDPARMIAQRRAGATQLTREPAFVDRGATAADTSRRGRAQDDEETAGASNETNPMPFDLAQARAGGAKNGQGVRGSRGSGPSDRGRGTGSAATRADLTPGDALPSVYAERQNPYFRRMYAQLDELVRFPKELAYSLDQGQVVVTFMLRGDGTFSGVTVFQSSGFDSFDREVTSAVKRAGPFGPVPRSVLGNRAAIIVRLPYAFRNSLIR